jgi:hypothetical protein
MVGFEAIDNPQVSLRFHRLKSASPDYKWIWEAKLQKICENVREMGVDSQSRRPESFAHNESSGIGFQKKTLVSQRAETN